MRPLLALTLLLIAAAPAPRFDPPRLDQPRLDPPRFDPIAFFAGRTEGTGRMTIMFGPARAVHVRGSGRVIGGDTIVLDQTVDRAGKKIETREWRIRRTTPGHYTGTLSDARGTIIGDSVGSVFHLAYRTRKGIRIEQSMTLAPGGRSAHNVLTARKLGVVVARLDETIRKLD